MRMIYARLLTAALLGASAILGVTASASADTGSQWTETEAGWQGVWVRSGRSDNWKATWTKGNNVVRADLTIIDNGSKIEIEREDTFGPGVGKGRCFYSGTRRGNTVSGEYTCPWSKTTLPFQATIVR
jgi:hypothetical protein